MAEETSREKFERQAREHYESEMADLPKVYRKMQRESYSGDPYDIEDYRNPLCFMGHMRDGERELEIQMSWGGPADGYLLTFSPGAMFPWEGYYYFQDWFTEKKKFGLTRGEIDMVMTVYNIDPDLIEYEPEDEDEEEPEEEDEEEFDEEEEEENEEES
jgi:hypothetical protein